MFLSWNVIIKVHGNGVRHRIGMLAREALA